MPKYWMPHARTEQRLSSHIVLKTDPKPMHRLKTACLLLLKLFPEREYPLSSLVEQVAQKARASRGPPCAYPELSSSEEPGQTDGSRRQAD